MPPWTAVIASSAMVPAGSDALLWKASVGGEVAAGPMSYQVDGKQYVAVAAGHSLFAYALR